MEQPSRGTHNLEIRGQIMLKERNRATKQRHSHPGQQRTGNVSRGETGQQIRGSHILKSKEQAMSVRE